MTSWRVPRAQCTPQGHDTAAWVCPGIDFRLLLVQLFDLSNPVQDLSLAALLHLPAQYELIQNVVHLQSRQRRRRRQAHQTFGNSGTIRVGLSALQFNLDPVSHRFDGWAYVKEGGEAARAGWSEHSTQQKKQNTFDHIHRCMTPVGGIPGYLITLLSGVRYPSHPPSLPPYILSPPSFPVGLRALRLRTSSERANKSCAGTGTALSIRKQSSVVFSNGEGKHDSSPPPSRQNGQQQLFSSLC